MVIASIIIPAFNEEKNLPRTIKAIRNAIQFANISCEVIAVDNHSEDNTLKVARGLADKVYSENHHVIARVRNVGALHAKGKYLIFIDADTVVPKNLIRDFIATLSTGAVVVGCKVMPHPLRVHEKTLFKLFNLILHSSVLHGAAFSGNAVGYRREIFNKLGGFDENRAASEDHDLSNRASRMGKAVFLKKVAVMTSNRRIRKLGLVKMVLGWTKTTLFYILGLRRRKYRIAR